MKDPIPLRELTIFIDPDGSVTFSDLTADMMEIAHSLQNARKEVKRHGRNKTHQTDRRRDFDVGSKVTTSKGGMDQTKDR